MAVSLTVAAVTAVSFPVAVSVATAAVALTVAAGALPPVVPAVTTVPEKHDQSEIAVNQAPWHTDQLERREREEDKQGNVHGKGLHATTLRM